MSNNVKWSWTILRCMRNLIIKMILKRKQVMMHNFILRKFYFPIEKYNHFYRTLSYYSFCIESLKCIFTCGKMIRAKRRSLISFSPYKNMFWVLWVECIESQNQAMHMHFDVIRCRSMQLQYFSWRLCIWRKMDAQLLEFQQMKLVEIASASVCNNEVLNWFIWL